MAGWGCVTVGENGGIGKIPSLFLCVRVCRTFSGTNCVSVWMGLVDSESGCLGVRHPFAHTVWGDRHPFAQCGKQTTVCIHVLNTNNLYHNYTVSMPTDFPCPQGKAPLFVFPARSLLLRNTLPPHLTVLFRFYQLV